MDGLVAVLVILLVIGLVTALTTLLVFFLAARALRKRNRVSPEVATSAPTTWMGSPVAGARLHRRLRTAVTVARASSTSATAAPHLTEMATALEREAVALDEHIVINSRLTGKQGRHQMATLAQQVRRVEQLASQVSMLSVQAQAALVGRGQGSSLDDLAHQLTLLEQAREEVAAVERDAGVERVSPFADPDRTPVPPRLGKSPPGQSVRGT